MNTSDAAGAERERTHLTPPGSPFPWAAAQIGKLRNLGGLHLGHFAHTSDLVATFLFFSSVFHAASFAESYFTEQGLNVGCWQ